MSVESPLSTPLESQMETSSPSPIIPTAIPTLEVSISDNPDLPILLKIDDRSESTISHVDENNENDAVQYYKIDLKE